MSINFTAMTWNVENLFPVGAESGPTSEEVYATKQRQLAETIRLIDADVIALQEIGAPEVLDDLHTALGGAYPQRCVSSHPDRRGIRVALFSRLPLAAVEDWNDFPAKAMEGVPKMSGDTLTQMGRGVLKATVTLAPGRTVNIVTLHLKSKLVTYQGHGNTPRFFPHDEDERARGSGFALLQRAAEAVAVRVYCNTLTSGNTDPLIVLGDFNDGPDAVTTQIVQGPEDRSFAHADRGDDVRLYNLAEYLPADHRFSRVYRKHLELIDHILVSHELIFRRQQVESFVQDIQSITDNPTSRRNAVIPDHAPVYARFELPDVTP